MNDDVLSRNETVAALEQMVGQQVRIMGFNGVASFGADGVLLGPDATDEERESPVELWQYFKVEGDGGAVITGCAIDSGRWEENDDGRRFLRMYEQKQEDRPPDSVLISLASHD
jgi:hypothetical protein